MRLAAAMLALLLPATGLAGIPSMRPGSPAASKGLLQPVASSAGLNLARAIEQMPGVAPDEDVMVACEDLQTPKPVSTPAPALGSIRSHAAIRVNFVITREGMIENPIVVLSAGTRLDRIVTRTISRWRYRPASCNGVPVQAEASIEFPAK